MLIPALVAIGEYSNDSIDWDTIARHVKWAVVRATSMASLPDVARLQEVPAVLLECLSIPVASQIDEIRSVWPRARVILCCPLESIDDVCAADYGAFHAVSSPLVANELRQSIGFAWASWSRERIRTLSPKPAALTKPPKAVKVKERAVHAVA